MIGAGGLGCPAALYLAASGVGRLTLADADKVDLTNLQRQILYRTDSVGAPKVEGLGAMRLHLRPPREVRRAFLARHEELCNAPAAHAIPHRP